MRTNFGKYVVPPTLQKLIDIQKDMGDTGHFYLGFDFFLSLEDFRYFNTPADVVVFGNIGVDGVHYGFLTDFGSVSDLEEATVVCVSPMDFDRPTRIVAKNLREFLRVNLTDSELFYNTFESEEDYLNARKQWVEENANSPYQPTEEDKRIRKEMHGWLIVNISLPIIKNSYHYVQDVERERVKTITIPTQDGLGVRTPLLEGEEHVAFLVEKYTDPDLNSLREYLRSAPTASKHALFRDIQLNYVLQEQIELRNAVIEEMSNLGLVDEVKRLSIET
ncbi:hypothetical protein MO973_02885 [Paenibacillus sp. TRM 82003]|nr:hypothetical protein [Paenibacillus sp. TRM 82003]